MSALEGLKPEGIWKYFGEVCQVPRPSKKEEKMTAYLKEFGESRNLKTIVEECGNVIISKEATKGMEHLPTVVIQSHIDMVCEKNSNVEHDFEKDPIQVYVSKEEDGDWVRAKGTTLGADDGIGVAAALALLDAKDVSHGPLEALFTVDEETGLTGAELLGEGVVKAKILINVDSEDEGQLFIGCAGGVDTTGYYHYEEDAKAVEGKIPASIVVKGLKGGHSGDDIEKMKANSVKVLNRLLFEWSEECGIRLTHINGGNLRNAIPREASARFVVEEAKKEEIVRIFEKLSVSIKKEFEFTEPTMEFELSWDVEQPKWALDEKAHWNIIHALYSCPHGVHEMSSAIKGLVQTSTNLSSVKMLPEKKELEVATLQRSSVDSQMDHIAAMVRVALKTAGAYSVTHTGRYPGWAPNPKSKVLQTTVEAFKGLFGSEPKVRAIHAGLECGLFLEKYPDMDMVSFGPTILGAHSPDERLEIATVGRFWDLLVKVLQSIE
eukprot:TRINITY_DN4560_c0_g1_i1.p1 TRINITY_DN4560_c0_g1~~TRINITY_DN4560_c0_g1_i1.p1  ORF type:complete len:493 (-),score=160.34 TRINITY_DN4560_c0_g1_i1:1631-3109(-)